jgi:hypothetical protein
MPRFTKGTSGNPGGRPKRQIANLGLEARKFADLALDVLVQVCEGGIKGVTPRDRLMAATSLYAPETLQTIAEVHAIMESQPGIGNVWSPETLGRWLAERTGKSDVATLKDT